MTIDDQMSLAVGVPRQRSTRLRDRFGAPPFTLLDAEASEWQTRKRSWLSLGIDGELGRSGGLVYDSAQARDPEFYLRKQEVEARLGRTVTTAEMLAEHYVTPDFKNGTQRTGTSIFDPVMCELAYRWFSPPGGRVLDPFAGGPVRGVTAAVLGRRYVGIELRPEQITANRRNALKVAEQWTTGDGTPAPVWVEGSATDARAIRDVTTRGPYDLLFTCPPYADLEVYSDDPRDLSTAPYPTFRAMLASAIAQGAELLAPDRFAVIVVGEARGSDGLSYGIIADTIRAGLDAGLGLVNEAILKTPSASAAVRAPRQFSASRKLVRTHQHVLVFVKGDAARAARACGDVDVDTSLAA